MDERKRITGTPFLTSPPPQGLGLTLYRNPDNSITGYVTLTPYHEGPPGHTHGGASAAMLDETIAMAVWVAGYKVVSASLNINYRKPLPLGIEVRLHTRVEKIEGRKIHARGHILLPDGNVAVEGSGLFIEAPHLLEKAPPLGTEAT